MKDKEKRITINREAGTMVDLLNNEIEELQKAKAIEEMEDIISGSWNTRSAAKNLFNAGYRKLPKNSVVLSKEEVCELKCQAEEDFNKAYDLGSKKTVKEILQKVKEKALLHCRTINCYELKFIEETIDELLEEYVK